jgi:hypothetical protein
MLVHCGTGASSSAPAVGVGVGAGVAKLHRHVRRKLKTKSQKLAMGGAIGAGGSAHVTELEGDPEAEREQSGCVRFAV